MGPSSADVTCPASAAAPWVSAGEEWEPDGNKTTAKLAITVSKNFFVSIGASSAVDIAQAFSCEIGGLPSRANIVTHFGNFGEIKCLAVLVEAITASMDYCKQAFAKLTDAKLGDPVTMFNGRPGTRFSAALEVTNDLIDHYAALAVYLRLNDLLPPTAQRKK